MDPNHQIWFRFRILWIALLLPAALCARPWTQLPQQPAPQGAPAASPQTATPNLQAISQTGLLPVYGMDLRLDASWVDSTHFPGTSTNLWNAGTSPTFQQIWATLQPGGYNVLRIPIDVRDPAAAANRAANLCVWAKTNNVQLILVLNGSDAGQPLPKELPNQVASFVKSLLTLMRVNNGQYLPAYAQIMAYQLDDELNHAGRHGGMAVTSAQQVVLEAAKSLRQTEHEALNGTGTAATPLMVGASFDFELIKAGAIAGGTMSDAAYAQAYQSLKQFLLGFSSSSDVDLFTIDWFAGSLGGGGIEKAPLLLKSLIADFSGKQIVFSAGFSTAFRSADEQKRLFTTAFSNLSDFRASNGADCPFVGTIYREALNGSNPNPTPPRATLPGEMDKWDWKARAAELTAMWTQKKKSDDMAWWLNKVENNMGLVTLQSDPGGKSSPTATASPAQQGMSQIATAVSDVNTQMTANAAVSAVPAANGFQAAATTSTSALGTTPGSNFYSQQPGTPANSTVNPLSNTASQPACSPNTGFNNPPANYYGQTYGQQYNQPYGQQSGQPYGQQFSVPGAMPPIAASAANCGTSGFAQNLQGQAQRGMLGLLDGVFQRLGSMAGGNGFGSGFNSSANAYNPYGNSGTGGAPYNYYNTATNSGSPSGQYPSNSGGQTNNYPPTTGAISPVLIQIGPQDVTLQPTNLQVGSPVSISVNLHNQSPADAYGLVVQAVGSDGSTLGQQSSLHVAPNSSSSITLAWKPAIANPAYAIVVNVADGSGNQLASTQTGLLVIAATPATGGTGSGGNTGTSDSGGTTIPLGAVTLSSVQVGTTGQTLAAGQPSSVVVSLANPYLVPLNNVKGSLSVDGNAVQTQTMSLLLPQQNRSLVFQGVIFPQAGQHQLSISVDSQRPGGQVLTASYSQPLTVPAASIAGATTSGVRKVGTALPTPGGDQTPGSHGPTANVRSVTPPTFQIGHLVVPSRPAATNLNVSAHNYNVGMLPANTGAPNDLATPKDVATPKTNSNAAAATASNALPPPSARPGMPAKTSVSGGALPTVLGRPGSSGPSGTTGTLLSAKTCAAPVSGGIVDLGADGPVAVTVSGQTIAFTVKVSNSGTAAVQGATVIFSVLADGRKITESMPVAIDFSRSGHDCTSLATWTWPTPLPWRGRTLEVRAVVLANGDKNSANNMASSSFLAPLR